MSTARKQSDPIQSTAVVVVDVKLTAFLSA